MVEESMSPEVPSNQGKEVSEIKKEVDLNGLRWLASYREGDDLDEMREKERMFLGSEDKDGENWGASFLEKQDVLFTALVGGEESSLYTTRKRLNPRVLSLRQLSKEEEAEVLRIGRDQIAEEVMVLVDDLGLKIENDEDYRIIENISAWAMGEVKERKGEVDEYLKEAYLYESFDTDEEWIDLARREFREREEGFQQYKAREFDLVGLESKTGVEIPMFKHMKGRENLRDSLKEEGRARLGIHNAFVAWKASCARPESFLRAFGFFVKDQDMPKWTSGPVDLEWLQTLSESEKGLGKDIGKALKLYIHEGEKSKKAYDDMCREKERNIGAKLEDKSENIFSQILQPAELKRVRGEIAKKTSGDGEEIAYRLMYLFGLAAKYGFTQGGCSEEDGLRSLFRVNDSWQNMIFKKGISPAPKAIVGDKDDYNKQPFRNVEFLESYPEMVGDVLLKNGEVKPLFDVLKDGDFNQVRWDEVGKGHGSFLGRVDKALKLRDKLSALTHKPEDVSVNSIKGLKDMIEGALEHEREIDKIDIKEVSTADGKVWKRRDFYQKKDLEDRVTQTILFIWAEGVIDQHSPLNDLVPLDSYWGLDSVDSFFLNLSSVLGPKEIKVLKKELRSLAWAFSLGSKRADRF